MSDQNPPPPDGSDPTPPPAPPPPPAGGYGAPPAGGYGAPPPSGSPYGVPGEDHPYNPGDALSFGWRHFTERPALMLLPVLLVGLAILVVGFIADLLVIGGMTAPTTGAGGRLLAVAVFAGIVSLITQILVTGLIKAGLGVADGRDYTLSQLFNGWDKVQVVVAGIILAVLTLVGSALCYFPALIVGYFTQFTLIFIVDQQLSAVDAIRASVRLCTSHVGPTILWFLIFAVLIGVGWAVCFVGLLVTAPIALVGLAYTYRRLQGQPVVEPAPKTA